MEKFAVELEKRGVKFPEQFEVNYGRAKAMGAMWGVSEFEVTDGVNHFGFFMWAHLGDDEPSRELVMENLSLLMVNGMSAHWYGYWLNNEYWQHPVGRAYDKELDVKMQEPGSFRLKELTAEELTELGFVKIWA